MVEIDATMILAWLNFLVLLLLLTKLLYKPVLDFLDKRAGRIEGSLEQAQRKVEESQRTLAEYERKLAGARTEAMQIIDSARSRAEEEAGGILSRAREDTERAAERARAGLERETAKARDELRREVGRLSVQVAENILRREFSPDDHQRYVDEYLRDVGGRG